MCVLSESNDFLCNDELQTKQTMGDTAERAMDGWMHF